MAGARLRGFTTADLLPRVCYHRSFDTWVLLRGKKEEVGVNYWPFQGGGARASQGERSPNPGPEHLFILAKSRTILFIKKCSSLSELMSGVFLGAADVFLTPF